jgi:hypothetical protein
MSHDELRLGVGVRLLVQQFDRRHFLAPLGDLDAVADQYQTAVGAQGCGEEPQYGLRPQCGEPVEFYGRAMEMVEELVVETRM